MKPSTPDRGNAREGKSAAELLCFICILKAKFLKMQISVNGINKIIESELLYLDQVLISENVFSSEGIAVAVNENIIPNKEWKNYHIQNNDKIIIIKAVQGG